MTEPEEAPEKKYGPTCAVQEIGPCKLKLNIEVAAGRIAERIDEKYRELNDATALPGFRKGHAPRNLLERKFGKTLLDDLKFEILNRTFEEVREEKKIEPVGEPEIDPAKYSVEAGKQFAYEITVEVRPVFEVKDYEGVRVVKPAIAVDDREVETVLRGFQESKAELVPSEDAVARENDQVIADFTLLVDGRPADTSENTAVFLTPEITFYGIRLEEFHKAVVGRRVGEAVEHPAKLPDDFFDKKFAGKPAVIRAAIKSVKRKKLPAVDEAFAKSFDMDSLDELRAHVRKRIEREKEGHAREEMADRIVRKLVEANSFPMPEGLVATGIEEAIQRLRLDLTMKGVPEDKIRETVENEKGRSREDMVQALRAHFILENIAQAQKIFVLEDQVEERIAQLAAHYGKWPHEMKAYLEEEGLLGQMRRRMREDLVREYLFSKAVIEEEKK